MPDDQISNYFIIQTTTISDCMRTGKTACKVYKFPETDRAVHLKTIISAIMITVIIPAFLVSDSSAIEFTFSGELSEISCGNNPVLNYDIEGDYLAFTESDSGINRLRLYDFSKESFTDITDSRYSDFRPEISVGKVAFQNRTLNGPGQIFVYNIQNGTAKAADPHLSSQGDAGISGNLLVWLDGRLNGYTNIFIKMSPDEAGIPLRISGTSDKHSPKIDSDYVYWTEAGDLHRKSFKTGDEVILIRDFPDSFEVYRGKVVFNGRGDKEGAVVMYDTDNGETTVLSSGDGFCRNPDISGDYVVYECYGDRGTAIRLYDLRTENGGILSEPKTGVSDPKVSENRIVWREKDSSSHCIVICRLDAKTLPLAGFEAEPLSGTAPLEVTFTGRAIVSASSGTAYLWDFGDGEYSESSSPVHTYSEPGIYDVSLTVENELGSFTAERKKIISVEEVPEADFSAFNREGAAPLNVQFRDMSSGKISERVWDFGDGSRSYNKNPVHVYTRPGIYSVNLTVSNEFGEVSENKTGYITAENSVYADFSCHYPENNSERLTIQFADESDGYTDSWLWYFGDGEYSDEQNPLHTFEEPGIYDITLEAGNGFASDIKTIMSVPAGKTGDEITKIYINPVSAGLKPGESVVFEAGATDTKGRYFPVEPEWTVSDGQKGKISSDGLFTAISPGSIRVIAGYQNITGYAGVLISESGNEKMEEMLSGITAIPETEKTPDFISSAGNPANGLKDLL
ncbi:PKD domain-containing protein [Methanoplanus endosymbiosus]|uniref:PKD domain-containing protein n=1 Tax=Methanoplanus endosymbiosus TaxID=33865 RepID=A0A9E7TKP4_9EURY|nr:PKD domain-containing protein [Methanoplanus endosymbiosus]UUX91426.1 PKD domain-containing protein [Methanoplanus endosymbiosus]